MKVCDVRQAAQDDLQRRIDRVVNRNSTKAGQHVAWGDTAILETFDAVGTDPFRDAFGRDWWKDFGASLTARLKRTQAKVERRGYAQDAAPADRDLLSKLVGLRFYFDNLRPGEPVNLKVVLPLLKVIENG